MNVTVTIGWTKSDMDHGYSSFSGYRPGAQQHTETFEVEVDDMVKPEDLVMHVANAAFYALNAPFVTAGTLAAQIADAVEAAGYHGEGAHYSLSVGDTVTVGEVMVSCESLGWKRAYPVAPVVEEVQV